MDDYRIWKVQQELNKCNNDWLSYITECLRDCLKEIKYLKNEINKIKALLDYKEL